MTPPEKIGYIRFVLIEKIVLFRNKGPERGSAAASRRAECTQNGVPFLEPLEIVRNLGAPNLSTYPDFHEKRCQNGDPQTGGMKGTPFSISSKS